MSAKNRETAVSPNGERHRLTVLVSDMVGSTVLGREMESEHLSELLGQLRSVWHQAAVRHGGRVIRTQGDGVFAIFGYPQSGEDDGRRAAEAALDIHGSSWPIAPRRLVAGSSAAANAFGHPCRHSARVRKAVSNLAFLISGG